MNIDLINQIAATIRRVDGNHTMSAGALAEAIAADLAAAVSITNELLDAAVEALIVDGWQHTHGGPLGIGTLDREDLRNIARTVLGVRGMR